MWGTTSKHAILIQSSHQIFPTGIPGKKHFSYCPGGHCCPAIYIQSLQLHRCTGQGEVNHHKNLYHYFKISSLIKDNSCSILLLPLSFLQPGLMNPSTADMCLTDRRCLIMQHNLTTRHPRNRTKGRQTTCLTRIANVAKLATQIFLILGQKKKNCFKPRNLSTVEANAW